MGAGNRSGRSPLIAARIRPITRGVRSAAHGAQSLASLLTSWKPGSTRSTVATSLGLGITAAFLALSLGPGQPAAHPSAALQPETVAWEGNVSAKSAELVLPEQPATPSTLPIEDASAGAAEVVMAPAPTALPRPDVHVSSQIDEDLRPRLSSRTGTRPAEEPAPTPTKTPIREITRYTVVEGDTVSGLAERYHISPETIVRANHLDNPESLSPGQVLVILPMSGQLHVVVEGDVIVDLATRYQVIPEDIIVANQLTDANALKVGQTLVIPDGPVAPREAAPAEPKPGERPLAPIKYKVVEGDTISGIAQKHGISAESIAWSNPGIADLDSLQVGQTLVLPPVTGLLHTVAAGDTVSDVAAYYNASATEIINVNSLQEPFALSIGQTLIVPGGEPPAPLAAAAPPTPTPRPPAAAPRPAPTAKPPAAPARVPAPAPAPAVVVASSGSARSTAASIAMRYVGYAYAWGGASPSTGFDCSGLTSFAYRQAGRPLPRDLWGQLNSGSRVSRGNLQVGDLVFFQNTYTAGLSHVGIYVGGDRFVHAASERTGVITTSLSDPYWSSRYVGASRP